MVYQGDMNGKGVNEKAYIHWRSIVHLNYIVACYKPDTIFSQEPRHDY